MDSATSEEPRSVAVVASLLFAVHLLLGGLSAERDSLTIDEHAHLAAGLSYVQLGDPRLNPEHPPLAKVLCALPLAQARWASDDVSWIRAGEWLPLLRSGQSEPARLRASVVSEWAFAHRFLYQHNRAQASTWIQRARWVTLLLSGLTGLLIFGFTRSVRGERAGLFALAVWTFSPTVLAHARLITTDACATLFSLATLLAAIRLLQTAPAERAPAKALWLGLALSGALWSKYSNLFLVGFLPVALLIWTAHHDRGARGAFLKRRGLELAGACGLAALVVVGLDLLLFGTPVWLAGCLLLIQKVPQNEVVRTYLLGATRDERAPSYFVVAFGLKATLGLIVITGWGLWAGVRQRAWRNPLPATLLAFGVLFFALVSARFPNVGVRYLLPLFPVLAIGAGLLFARVEAGRPRQLLIGLLLAHAAAGALAWPRYLPYMNLVSATRGKAFFLDDSNLDWGQGLRALGAWCRERAIKRIAYLPANLIADPSFYGVPGVTIRGGDLERLAPGTVVAISVVHLQRRPALRTLVAQSEQLGVVAETLVVIRISP